MFSHRKAIKKVWPFFARWLNELIDVDDLAEHGLFRSDETGHFYLIRRDPVAIDIAGIEHHVHLRVELLVQVVENHERRDL